MRAVGIFFERDHFFAGGLRGAGGRVVLHGFPAHPVICGLLEREDSACHRDGRHPDAEQGDGRNRTNFYEPLAALQFYPFARHQLGMVQAAFRRAQGEPFGNGRDGAQCVQVDRAAALLFEQVDELFRKF